MAFSVEAALDAYVVAQSPPREFDGLWHPSATSGCQRKAIYEMRQVEPTDPQTPRQKRVLFIGSRIHEIVQAALHAYDGVSDVFTEVRVTIPELNLTGSADGVVLLTILLDDGSAELIEIKTIKEWGFKKLSGPKGDHLEQTKDYMLGLREYGGEAEDGRKIPPLGARLQRVRFIYVEKQTLDIKEFLVDWDPAWEQEVRHKVEELEVYKSLPWSLPPRLPKNGKKLDYRCDWNWGKCPFFTRCWETDPDEVAPDF